MNTPVDPRSEREDRLDRYRVTVERLLGDRLSVAAADDFETLFEHISACFDRDVDEETCARTWVSHGDAAKGA